MRKIPQKVLESTMYQNLKRIDRKPFPVRSTFKAKDGVELSSFEFPTKDPDSKKANLIYVPGFGECCYRYGYFFEKLAAENIHTYCFDRRGFGYSRSDQIQTGRIDKQEAIDDLSHYVYKIYSDQQHLPFFLFGYSLGGLLATNITFLKPNQPFNIKGLISYAPAFGSIPQWSHVQIEEYKQMVINGKGLKAVKPPKKDRETELFLYYGFVKDQIESKEVHFKWQANSILNILEL